jgi:tetratricopeptide (TPR) repeat protein
MNPAEAALSEQFQGANALHNRGQLAEARAVCEGILAAEPRHAGALHLLGLIAAQAGNPCLALELIDRALAIDPHNAAAYCNKATALQELKQWDAALANYDEAIARKPDYAVAHSNRGNVLAGLRRWEAALASYDAAIAIQADFAVAWSNRGHALRELKRWEDALASYDRAIALKADFAEAWSNRGIVLKALDRLPEALASYDRAIGLRPGYAEAHANRGNVLKELNEWDAALACYERAIAAKPEFADAHFNKAIALLALGNFTPGWIEYEWRWKNPSGLAIKRPREFSCPLWLGREPLTGKSIVLHCEQGLGDTLQFFRYVRAVADLAARVILEVQQPLVRLLEGSSGAWQLLAEGSALPDADYHCPLLSLPLAFGTTPDTIPPPAPLAADPGRNAHWRARLGERRAPRVGLVWSGNVNHANDRHRSVSLAEWVSHLPDGFQYVSLQKEVRDVDRQALRAHPAILDLSAELHDFSDTAAVCANLDLLLSADTSVAHLGGSLGTKTWLLLPFNPDWRWLLNRSDTPWYPSVTLYRQQHLGDWRSVLRQIGAELTRLRHAVVSTP